MDFGPMIPEQDCQSVDTDHDRQERYTRYQHQQLHQEREREPEPQQQTRRRDAGRIIRLQKDAEQVMDNLLGKDGWITSDVSLTIKYFGNMLQREQAVLDDFRRFVVQANQRKRAKSRDRKDREERRRRRKIETAKLEHDAMHHEYIVKSELAHDMGTSHDMYHHHPPSI